MRFHPLFLGAALAAVTAGSVFGAKLGDPASPLSIKDWVQGAAVDVKDGRNIYVVEFWATWCGPCRTSIPHLSELQRKFKDENVVFIGISDEAAATVKPFVEKMGEKMAYTVACDDNRKSSAAYMEAFAQNGIPHAFIVNKEAKIIWRGHPMAGLDNVLDEIVAGTYDAKGAAKKDEARALMDDYQQLSLKGDAKATELGRQLLARAGGDVEALCDLAFGIVANPRNKNRDFALAEEALAKAETAANGKHPTIIGTRSVVTFEAGKQEEGLKLAKEALELAQTAQQKNRYENYVRFMESRIAAKANPQTPGAN